MCRVGSSQGSGYERDSNETPSKGNPNNMVGIWQEHAYLGPDIWGPQSTSAGYDKSVCTVVAVALGLRLAVSGDRDRDRAIEACCKMYGGCQKHIPCLM